MAQKISLMTAISAGNLDDTALFETVDKNGASRKSTLAQLRTALLTAALFTTSFGSAAGFVSLGAAPNASGAIRVDAATYSGLAINLKNATGLISIRATSTGADAFFGTESSAGGTVATSTTAYATLVGSMNATSLQFLTNGVLKWSVYSEASISSLASGSVTARIISGSTSFSVRNSANTNDNLLVSDAGAVTVRSTLTVTGIFGIGGLSANTSFYVGNTLTAISGSAAGLEINPTFIAAANNDILRSIRVDNHTVTPGSFTGLQRIGLDINGFSVAGYTSPANPIVLQLGSINGTGAAIATTLLLSAPTGAGTNYLISHATPATFSVTGAGGVNAATYAVGGVAGADFSGAVAAKSFTIVKGIVTAVV